MAHFSWDIKDLKAENSWKLFQDVMRKIVANTISDKNNYSDTKPVRSNNFFELISEKFSWKIFSPQSKASDNQTKFFFFRGDEYCIYFFIQRIFQWDYFVSGISKMSILIGWLSLAHCHFFKKKRSAARIFQDAM